MSDYKITQNTKKSNADRIRSFWIPVRQQKLLRKKSVVISLSVVGVLIIGGAVFATLKLRNKPIYLHGAPPPKHGATIAEKNQNNSFYAITAAAFNDVTNAITDQNATLLNSYYASQVRIVIVNGLINETVNGSQAADIINNGLDGAGNSWDYHVPASELSDWQAGPDGQYFDGLDVIGISDNGTVISIGFDTDGNIDSVFIAPSSDLDNPTTTAPDSGDDNTPTNIATPTGVNATD